MSTNLQFIKSQTISSSVANISITDVFSANYDVYKMTVKAVGLAGGTASRIDGRLINSSGSVISSSNYDRAELTLKAHTSFQELRSVGADTMFDFLPATDLSPLTSSSVVYFFNPFSSSSYTFMTVQGASFLNSEFRGSKSIFVLKTTDSITGVQLITGGGDNLAEGIISVYGVK